MGKTVVPVICGMALLGWLLSGLTQVPLHQWGIYERFGRPLVVLAPGLHVGLPWPFGRVRAVEYGAVHELRHSVTAVNRGRIITCNRLSPFIDKIAEGRSVKLRVFQLGLMVQCVAGDFAIVINVWNRTKMRSLKLVFSIQSRHGFIERSLFHCISKGHIRGPWLSLQIFTGVNPTRQNTRGRVKAGDFCYTNCP